MKYWAILIIFTLALACGVFIGAKVFGGAGAAGKAAVVNINAAVKEVLPASEYASLVYQYSSIITHSEAVELFSIPIPLTEKKAIYTIDGTIKLGFDCKDIKIDLSYNNIILRMPRIKILSHEIYPETFSLYDEKTSLFNKYTLTDANNIQKINKKEIEIKARQNRGLYIQARKFAEEQISGLLESAPAIKGKYTIVFEWS
ncbi:MAG: DUF4230 domain-containing protein [Endomicrobium sp.]|jgi:hypothetical protein|nr:DUF4230 domain-containing protein [Endomicrobium sp.]